MSAHDPDDLGAHLSRWVEAHYGPGATATSVAKLPGHAGTTVAFDATPAGGAAPADRLVVRLPPAGVRRQGTTDVLRQVPLLQAMERRGVPVPRVRWWGDDERWFGVPFLVVDFVAGATLGGDLFVLDDGPTPDAPAAAEAFGHAVDALAAIHRVDWERDLAGWDRPLPLAGEIDRWVPLLDKALDPAWTAAGHELRAALHASAPPEPEPGVVHADYYSNNWLFREGRLAAVLDWEATFVGPRLLDLGWLCMMYDPESWAPGHGTRMAWSPPTEFFAARYERASGARVDHLAWYRALAGYRLAALTAHYYRLHRLGRRPDPVWEVFAESAPHMLRRATRLARGEGGG